MNLSPAAQNYCWRRLAERAGLPLRDAHSTGFEIPGISLFYTEPETVQTPERALIVSPCKSGEWQALLNAPPGSIEYQPAENLIPSNAQLPFSGDIPILFRSTNSRSRFAEIRDNQRLIVHVDILAAAFFMLSRWEETQTDSYDHDGRFTASQSVAFKQKFLDQPIIDYYGIILREWLRILIPEWQPAVRRSDVLLTHDVDEPLKRVTWRTAIRTAAGDMVKRRSPQRAFQTLYQNYRAHREYERDENLTAMRRLMQITEEHKNLKSAFFFMTAAPSRYDNGYDLRKKPFYDILTEVVRRGHEIGFHPGYTTFLNEARFQEELSRMREVISTEKIRGRQHYLRFRVPQTWRTWANSPILSEDMSPGYADYEGFRAGTCYPFPVFDIEQDSELDLIERPLIVMETTLMEYRQVTPQAAERIILDLAQKCQQVGGSFVLLWHNTTMQGEWGECYSRIVAELAKITD